jgi:hypothetical protein
MENDYETKELLRKIKAELKHINFFQILMIAIYLLINLWE